MSAPAPLLEVSAVDAGYGPYRALFEVSFSVAERSAVALVGANGAGKSTVARVVSGLVRASSGSVRFAGEDITRYPAWRIARLGLVHAPEGRAMFGSLTVEENLVLPFRQAVGRRGLAGALARAYDAFPRLGERRRQVAGTLSGGEQRMLALAKVLAVPQRLLVVDEMSLGLAPVVVDEVFAGLQAVLDAGTALLVVEQHVDRALSLAQDVVLLAKGRVVRQGPVDEVGGTISDLLPARATALSTREGLRPGGGLPRGSGPGDDPESPASADTSPRGRG